ncbi:FliH/SctL family protein [Paraburkholderia bannensis]|uniref:FliH/SctL family protein n=1 Tax=Paraburkholderia bannensis TaxID=765414 RepID=UPI002AB63ED3|nr:FliH/SctL family protein [Paraburkholderia bannensis]
MLIWRLADWHIEVDGYIDARQFAQLDEIRALRSVHRQLAATELSRLAARARLTKRRAIARGYAAGRAAALHDLVVPAAACAFALEHLRECLVQIALKAITEVIGQLPPGATLPNQLRHCLKAAPGHRLLSVRVAASDLDEARRAIGVIEQELGLSLVTVLPDANLPPRSCVVETDGGVIDGSLRQQLGALERGMRDAIAGMLGKYTRMDDTLPRQLDVVAAGLRDTLDLLSRAPSPPSGGSQPRRAARRKPAKRTSAGHGAAT